MVRRHNEYTVIKDQMEKDADGDMGQLGLKFRAARDQSIQDADAERLQENFEPRNTQSVIEGIVSSSEGDDDLVAGLRAK